jgi:molecular chaperone GrpE
MSKQPEDKNPASDPASKWAKINTVDTEAAQEPVQPDSAVGFSEEEVEAADADAHPSEEVPVAEDSAVLALRAEVEQLQDQLLREAADKQNLRTRMQRDVQAAHKFASAKFIEAILPVIDSLEQALQAPAVDGDSAMRDGMQMTINMFAKVLSDHGVVIINPEAGTAFDPDQHSAMSTQNDPKHPDNSVLSVLQKGYDLNGRVVRAAMVVVNKH